MDPIVRSTLMVAAIVWQGAILLRFVALQPEKRTGAGVLFFFSPIIVGLLITIPIISASAVGFAVYGMVAIWLMFFELKLYELRRPALGPPSLPVEASRISPWQLDEARKVRRQSDEADPFFRELADLGMVGEREVLNAKAQSLGVPFVDIDRVNIESSAIDVVPARIARNHAVMPVKKEGHNLWIAMGDVNNTQALDDVRMVSGCRVIPVMAVPEAIAAAIQKSYGP